MAINAVRDCGYEIALNRMPRSIGPLIFGEFLKLIKV
jgi:hypothetical protein